MRSRGNEEKIGLSDATVFRVEMKLLERIFKSLKLYKSRLFGG